MYSRYAELFHLPSVWIRESSNPLLAAVLAAPIRKLWPVKPAASRPVLVSACCTSDTIDARERGEPDSKQKSGPGLGLRTAM